MVNKKRTPKDPLSGSLSVKLGGYSAAGGGPDEFLDRPQAYHMSGQFVQESFFSLPEKPAGILPIKDGQPPGLVANLLIEVS